MSATVFDILVSMTIDPLDRAQIIVDKFRIANYELQEKLIAEQVNHEIAKREIESLRNTVQALNETIMAREEPAE